MPDNQRRSIALQSYIGGVMVVGALVLTSSVAGLLSSAHRFEWAVLALSAIIIGNRMITISLVEASVSVSDTFFIASALLFGPAPATVALAANSCIFSWRKRHDRMRLAFNTATPALSLWAASHAFYALTGIEPLAVASAPLGPLLLPLLSLTAIYFLLNSGFMAVAIGLQLHESPLRIWRRHFMWLSSGYLASASAAVCLVLIVQQLGALAVAVILPVVVVFHQTLRASFGRLDDTSRHLAQVDRLYQSTVETLAMAIDAKDDVTHSHVRRVQAYAAKLARALGVSDETTLKAIQAAALLHDTGKLAVPERILNKPGRLTPEEFERMKEHVEVGANILALVDFPFPVVPIVRCHHENWDGTGYPHGVAGDAIPIGARILSVVDCFDALTSDRPYRRRLSTEAALDILRDRRGTMYDPTVVDTFIAIHAQIGSVEPAAPAHQEVFGRIARSLHGDAPPIAEPPALVAREHGADTLSFVSLSRLASGTIALKDVLTLASRLVQGVVPDATGAWYLPGADGRLTAVDAFGPAAASVLGTTVDVGSQLTGWVAANRQVILNSDAALDLGTAANVAGLTNSLSVPLAAGQSLAGVLTLYASGPDAFTDDQGRLGLLVAPHLAQAIRASDPGAFSRPASRELRLVSSR